MPLIVSEIFHSIQGEGSRAGLPCLFIRLQGCGLRCRWCDTPYALDFGGGTEMDEEELLAQAAESGSRFIELTGGEPLEQPAVYPLLSLLCNDGYTVAVETGGHVDINRVDPRVILIMDVKCPGSGMEKKNLLANLDYLKPTDELKFVLVDRADYEWARDFVRGRDLPSICREIIFSPVFGRLDNRALAEWILKDKLPVRMQLQMHKYIWEPDARGV
ncbi:MAG: radical SAM protein [Ignavibacteria bacterium]|nr:radical SAM protein [Ignavibacteria bacterium]